MITVLGLVLGLVVSFRTSSAYERYSEGRKLWSALTLASRNLAMGVSPPSFLSIDPSLTNPKIWIHVSNDRIDRSTSTQIPHVEIVIEKKSMINLIQAYAVSLKHFLRGEQGIYYEDLHPLVCWLPRFSCQPPSIPTKEDVLPLWSETANEASIMETPKNPGPVSGASAATLSDLEKGNGGGSGGYSRSDRKRLRFDPEAVLPDIIADKPLQPSRNPPETTFWDYFSMLRFLRPLFRVLRGKSTSDLTAGGRIKKQMNVESNVPLEISLFLSSYVNHLITGGLVQPAIATSMVGNLSALQDINTNLERIRNTPLPFAYQAHLRICMWIYIFSLPFQIYSAYKWLTIPCVFLFPSFVLN